MSGATPKGTLRDVVLERKEDLNIVHLSSKALVKCLLISSGNWVPCSDFPLERIGGNDM